MACGIFPDQGWDSCSLYWQADSLLLSRQGSPQIAFLLFPNKSVAAMWISFCICSQEALLRAILSRLPHFGVYQNHPGSLSKRSPGPVPKLMYQNLGGVGSRHLYFKPWWFCPPPRPSTPVFLPGKSHGQRTWWAIVHGVAKVRHYLTINHNCNPILTPTPSTTLWPLILEPVQRNLVNLPLHVALL